MKSSQGSGGDPPAQFEPTQAWLDAFHEQYSTTLVLLAQRHAARRAAGVGRSPRAHDEDARRLVLEVLADTLVGAVQWDPDTKTLAQHLQDVIRRRTPLRGRRAPRARHESIDAMNTRGQSPALIEAERILRTRSPDPDAAAEAARRIAVLRIHAVDDPEVLAFVDAKIAGCETRAEVMQRTGLSEPAYRRVRRRFAQLLERLPTPLDPEPRTGAWS